MKPSWKIRRRIIIATLAFCAFVIAYSMVWGDERPVHETIVLGAFALAGAVIGSYIFGAAWDDRNVMKELGPAAYLRAPEPAGEKVNTTVFAQHIDGPQP